MKNRLVFTNDGSHSIFNPTINETYHSKHGAIVEAEHVFIKNGFSQINKSNFSILEVGLGTGLNALLTAQKAMQKSITINYQAIELFPVKKEHYEKLNFTDLIGIESKQLINIHESEWGKKNKINNFFTLTKHHNSLEEFNTNLKFNIIYFDAFSPEKQPHLWSEKVFKKMYYFLKNDGFLVTYCAKGEVKRTLKSVGFKIIVLDGPPGKRQMTRAEKKSIQK